MENTMIKANALYYPYVAFADATWLKAMSLLYDTIYRIVPDNTVPNDNEELQPLLEDPSIGKMIDPVPYASAASDEFMAKLPKWHASALHFDPDDDKLNLTDIHKDKIDSRVRQLFSDIGFKETDQWLSVPTEYASNYMLFLARSIASQNQLEMTTPAWAPWTATSYFNLDGNIDEFINPIDPNSTEPTPFSLFSLILSEITPLNIASIPASRIHDFRAKRGAEIARLRQTVIELYDELQILHDPAVRMNHIQNKIKELVTAKNEFQRSADILKAKGWFGVSFMGLTAPTTLCQLFNIPARSTAILAGTALALGGIFNIANTRHELEKLRKTNPGSCLYEMRRSFRNYTSARSGGDMNYHAYNCMEEYEND